MHSRPTPSPRSPRMMQRSGSGARPRRTARDGLEVIFAKMVHPPEKMTPRKDLHAPLISPLSFLPGQFVNEAVISQKVIQGVYPGVTTVELDELAAQTAASFATQHPDYAVLAARIEVSNLHKETEKQFSKVSFTDVCDCSD